MRIVSLVLRIAPASLADARPALSAIPGLQLQAWDAATGKLIVTIEDGPAHSTADSILAAHKVPQVLSATLAYEYGGDEHGPPGCGPPACGPP